MKSVASGMTLPELLPKLNLCFQPFPVLHTPRLLLRQVQPDDVDEIFFLRSDPSVLQYIDRYPARSKEEAAAFIDNVRKWEAANESILWAMCFPENQKLIGTIGYWRIQPEHFRAEIGYVLHPQHHGNGLMTEAMKAVIDYAFEVMRLHSIEANINPMNEASKQVLLKNGFVQEAYFRENFYFDGKFLDSMIFSKING